MKHVDTDLLQFYLDRFCNRFDVYSKQFWTRERYWYEPIWQPVTLDVINAHLQGDITLAFYALSAESTCKWLTFDFDDDRCNRQKLAIALASHGWQVVLEGKRPGREGHLWLFFDEPVPALHLRRFAHVFLKSVGISDKGIEVFPKKHVLDKVGSAVRGPLGIHRKPGAGDRGWFDGLPNDIAVQLEWFANQPLNSSIRLLQMADELRRRSLLLVQPKQKRSGPSSMAGEGRIDWQQYALDNLFKSSGGWQHGPCPSCRADGHDSGGNHLYVSPDGAVGCFRGCSFEDILAAAS